MLECLNGYIGLTMCYGEGVYDVPPSGIYINSLPGLQLESIEKIATQEQVTLYGVWDDVQTNASAQFKSDLMAELLKCYKMNCECDYEALICDNIEILTQSWKFLLGVWILLFRVNSNRVNRYTTIDRAQAQELLAFYQVQYENALKQAAQCMDVSDCELCCGGNPEIITWLP